MSEKNEMLTQIEYILTKDSLTDAERISDALVLVRHAAAASAEPVGWLGTAGHGYSFTAIKSVADSWEAHGTHVQAIYTHPAPDAEIVAVLEDLITATVNPGDGGEFEVGEFPELDRARAALAKAKGGSAPAPTIDDVPSCGQENDFRPSDSIQC